MIELVHAPTIRRADFDVARKQPGLAAIVRLRNEEDFAEASLNSILPHFDEIVIVFNDCTDRTPEIVAEFALENPERVRAYHYLPRVFPQDSEQHRRLPPHSVHSLVHYTNFALSKTTYQVQCKWDGDQVADPESFGRVVRQLRYLERGSLAWWLSPWRWGYWWYTGINLWDHDGQINVLKPRPLLGRKRDHGFSPASRHVIYKHHARFEYLFTRLLAHRFGGCLFFHLKGMKKDRGMGVYQLDQNPPSPALTKVVRLWTQPELQTIQALRVVEPSIRHLPDPADLGIAPIVQR